MIDLYKLMKGILWIDNCWNKF